MPKKDSRTIDTNYLTPGQMKEVLEDWIKDQTKYMSDPNNARYQVVTTKVSASRDIINILLL